MELIMLLSLEIAYACHNIGPTPNIMVCFWAYFYKINLSYQICQAKKTKSFASILLTVGGKTMAWFYDFASYCLLNMQYKQCFAILGIMVTASLVFQIRVTKLTNGYEDTLTTLELLEAYTISLLQAMNVYSSMFIPGMAFIFVAGSVHVIVPLLDGKLKDYLSCKNSKQ
jgi:hypothetical protein